MPRFSTIQKRMIMKRMKNLSPEQRKMMMSIANKKGKGLQLSGQRRRPKQRGSGLIPKKFLKFVKQFPKEAKIIIKSAKNLVGGRQAGSGFKSALGILGLVGATAVATGLGLREYLIRNPAQIAKLGVQAAKFAISGSGIRLAGRGKGVLNPSGSGIRLAGRGIIPKKILSFIKKFPVHARNIIKVVKKQIKKRVQIGSGLKLSQVLGGLTAISAAAVIGGVGLVKYLQNNPGQITRLVASAAGPSGGGLELAGFQGEGLGLAGRGIPKKALAFIKRFPTQAKNIFRHIRAGDHKKIIKIIGSLAVISTAALIGGVALNKYLSGPGIIDKIPAESLSLLPIKKFTPVVADIIKKNISPDPGVIAKLIPAQKISFPLRFGPKGSGISGQRGSGAGLQHHGLCLMRCHNQICRKNIMVL